jgi:16S rRNA (uracil1498-N3)-methyltransferase
LFLTDSFGEPANAAVGGEVVLRGPDGRHAASVVRIAVGEHIRIGNGRGVVLHGVVVRVGRDEVAISVQQRLDVPEASPRVVVVQALPKGDRGELAVELMTELGVDEIVPWAASRCVAQWRGERIDKGLAKWRSTARAATKQSRRARQPLIASLHSTAQVAQLVSRSPWSAVLHEDAKGPLLGQVLPDGGDVVLIVGPEGGISDDELSSFVTAGARAVLLGTTVMRTSTAGAAALAALAIPLNRWG